MTHDFGHYKEVILLYCPKSWDMISIFYYHSVTSHYFSWWTLTTFSMRNLLFSTYFVFLQNFQSIILWFLDRCFLGVDTNYAQTGVSPAEKGLWLFFKRPKRTVCSPPPQHYWQPKWLASFECGRVHRTWWHCTSSHSRQVGQALVTF